MGPNSANAAQSKGGIDNFLDEVIAMSGMNDSQQKGAGNNIPVPQPRPDPSMPENVPVPQPRPEQAAEGELSPEATDAALANIEQQGAEVGASAGEMVAAAIAVVGIAAATAWAASKFGPNEADTLIQEGQLLLTDQSGGNADVDAQNAIEKGDASGRSMQPSPNGPPEGIEQRMPGSDSSNVDLQQALMDEMEGNSSSTRDLQPNADRAARNAIESGAVKRTNAPRPTMPKIKPRVVR